MCPELWTVTSLRAVVTDLDGTIVRPDGTVSAATVAAVAALRAAEVPLIVAAARTPAGISVLGPMLADVSVAVCCNGTIGPSSTRHRGAVATLAGRVADTRAGRSPNRDVAGRRAGQL